MMIKVTTDCAFAGCETIHYVEVDECMTEQELDDIAYEFAMEDITPSATWEEVDDSEPDEMGYDVE